MRGRSRSGGPGVFVVSDAVEAPSPSDHEIRISQFFLEIGLSREPILPPEPASPCTGGGTVALAADPLDGTGLATSRSPLVWIVLHLDSGDRAYSYLPLPDAATYHAGFKEPRILSLGRPRRALSDRLGGFQTSSVDLVLIDTDRAIRGRMSAEALLNREFELWMADDATRRAEGVARPVGHYTITGYEPIGDFTFRITGSDFIGSEISQFFAEQSMDLPLYSRAYFPQLPQATEGLPIPGFYGNVSDESLPTSADGPVVLDPTQGAGGILDGVYPNFGWVDDNPVAAPASLSVGQGTGGSFADGTYYLLVSAIVGGVESNPYPVDGSGVGLAVTGGSGTATIIGDTPDVVGATAYRWYLSDKEPASHQHFSQTLELFKATTLSTVTFTGPTDGSAYLNVPMWAVVIAKMPDGVTLPQRSITNDTGVPQYEGFVKLIPSTGRPTRIAWTALPGAEEYWVYLRGASWPEGSYFGAPDSYTTRFIVDAGVTVFDYAYGMVGEAVTGLPGTEQELGAIPWPYVGEWVCPDGVTRSAFVGATGTLGNIQSLFGSDGASPTPRRQKISDALYGVSVFAPRKTGWLYPTNYVEVASSESEPLWLTMIFVDPSHPIAVAAKDGTIEITGNICGYTTNADGTGNTISSGPLQALHFVTNFGPREDGAWRSGAWKTIPTRNGVPVYRSSSFEAVKTLTEALIDGGFECAWGIGIGKDAPKLFDFLAAVAINLHIRWGVNEHGQLFMRLLDADAGSVAAFTDATNIPGHAVPTITPGTQDLINKIRYVFKQNYISSVTNTTPAEAARLPPQLAETPDWYSGYLEEKDDASKARHKVWKPVDIQFAMHRDGRAPRLIVLRLLAMLAWPLNLYRWPASLLGLDVQLGSIVTFTHAAGAGASGDTDRRIYLSAVELEAQMTLGSPSTFDVWLEGEDITDLVLPGAPT